jgi:hypothetical protein
MFTDIKKWLQDFMLKRFVSLGKWAVLKILGGTIPKDKDGAKQWIITLCDNSLTPIVTKTETKLDDTAVDILRFSASNETIWAIVWETYSQGQIPTNITDILTQKEDIQKTGLFARVRASIAQRFGLSDVSEVSEQETESVATVVLILSLIANAKPAMENVKSMLQKLEEKIKQRRSQQ